MTNNLFIAATSQNEGKTSLCVGLLKILKDKLPNVGFMKPVGQKYVVKDSHKVDEDALVISNICDLNDPIQYMSPIAIAKGFTKKYILEHKPENLSQKVKKAYNKISKSKKFVLIEGTGHAGVGSVFDLSNADVAKLLNSKVLLITSGGIGRPIDEILLNKALFEKLGVELLGVVVNKVIPEKYEKVSPLIKKRLLEEDVDAYGVIPYKRILSRPTMEQIAEEMGLDVLIGKDRLNNSVNQIIVGAMEPHDALNYMEEKSLVITPGDREDIILTATTSHLADKKLKSRISGIILTGNITPHKSIINMIKKSEIPVLVASQDTYTVASNVHDLTVKLTPHDRRKADIITELVREYVDIDRILNDINMS